MEMEMINLKEIKNFFFRFIIQRKYKGNNNQKILLKIFI